MPGQEADFVVLDPSNQPLLERRISKANSLEEVLFAYIVLADDRVVEQTFVAGA
jgi:guanine deaminase